MMTLLESYVRRGHRLLHSLLAKPAWRLSLQTAAWFLAGFCLSAASLGNAPQPLPLAVLCAGLEGWLPLAMALGSGLGYWIFWGQMGFQPIFWTAAGLSLGALLYRRQITRQLPLLQPALAAAVVAVSGVIFQTWRGDMTPIVMYLLRIGLAFGGTWIFALTRDRRDPIGEWVTAFAVVLALAQIVPLPFLGLGFAVAAAMVAVLPFPAVALAGLALDLAGVTPVPMTAVLCLSYMTRLIPEIRRYWVAVAPAALFAVVMALCGHADFLPIPALLLGGVVGVMLPRRNGRLTHHRGETGFAQVRLEMAAEVISQSEKLLLETTEQPIDERVLIQKAAERACGGCPCRKTCKETERAKNLPAALLHQPLGGLDELPIPCKKRSRLLSELRHSRERYRMLKADRDRQAEYRGAVLQQYRFLSEYLQDLADKLPHRDSGDRPRFQPEVSVCSNGKTKPNGDRCLWFAGTDCRYFLLICDGMGTGEGAARASDTAAQMLRRLLMAGYPAPYALRSLNSLCTLRGDGAAVTVDLAEFYLDTGKVTLYKWGAAPSWLLQLTGREKIGSMTVPPGFSVTHARETVDRITMRRGEVLVLLSDGVDGEKAMRDLQMPYAEAPGTLASKIMECGETEDDATVAVIRLIPL